MNHTSTAGCAAMQPVVNRQIEEVHLTTASKTKVETNRERLSRLEHEVEALRAQLRNAQRLATVGTMTAMVAHEFNNILTPIISYARLARKNPALVDKALTRAADGGARATHICQALLGVTRDDDRPKRLRLLDLVRDTLDAMARKLDQDAIELQLDVPDDLEITTQPTELQQVLLNLLINARSAVMGKPGLRQIRISARSSAGQVVIRVADNGEGIPPENLEMIFQPFFSTRDSLDGESQGAGLGLAFCREMMASLNGDISVESTPGRGATFTLRLSP